WSWAGLKEALCLPDSRRATLLARRPSTTSVASTTHHLRSSVPGLTITVLIENPAKKGGRNATRRKSSRKENRKKGRKTWKSLKQHGQIFNHLVEDLGYIRLHGPKARPEFHLPRARPRRPPRHAGAPLGGGPHRG